jgi:hypothetical protein
VAEVDVDLEAEDGTSEDSEEDTLLDSAGLVTVAGVPIEL